MIHGRHASATDQFAMASGWKGNGKQKKYETRKPSCRYEHEGGQEYYEHKKPEKLEMTRRQEYFTI